MDINITNKNGIILNTRNKVCEDDININIDNSQEILPENIAKDVTILGVTGTLEPSNIDQLINGEITTINIPNNVTKIRDYVFYKCSNLSNITIPNSVTRVGDFAFAYCSSLTSINIPNSVTSIGNAAFARCGHLTSINIPNSVTSIGNNAFEYCGLTSINIPNSVTSISWFTFYSCSRLTSITIPNSVTSIINSAFAYCSSLTSINIPNSVTSIENYAFRQCSSLTDVTIENGFNANGLDLSASTKYTHDTILSWLNALYDRSNLSTYTLTIGIDNLNKLTDEEKVIATNKNWTLT